MKILKVGKIFQCVTLYQYFFINDKSCYQLIMATHITNINNSLTMISMRVMWHHIYIGWVCQNCFAHSVLVLMALFMVLSNFVKGTIRWIRYTRLLNYLLYIFWSTTLNCLSKQILTLNLTDSIIIIIILIIHTVLVIKPKLYKWNVLKLSTEVIVCRFSSK